MIIIEPLEQPEAPRPGDKIDDIINNWYRNQVDWCIKLNNKIDEINEKLGLDDGN